MQFLHAIILSGLGAALIPLIIHLFSRRKPKDVVFPSVEFLERMKTDRLRRLKFRQLLALILRILAVAMIILAFARPALRGTYGKNARTAAVIVIDPSASMRYIDNGESLFDAARRGAVTLLGLFGPGDRVVTVIAGDEPSVLGNEPSTDRKRLARDIEAAESIPGPGNTTAAFRRALELLVSSGAPNREVYYLTDGAAGALPDSVAPSPGVRMYVLQVGPEKHDGAAIEDFSLRNRFPAPGERIVCAVSGRAGTAPGVAVELFVNGARTMKKDVAVAPGGLFTVDLEFTPDAPGWYSLRAAIPDGRFESGENRWLAIRVPVRKNALLCGGTPDDLLFVEKALALVSGGALSIKETGAGEMRRADIDSADVVVLAGVRSLSDGLVRDLFGAVADRGMGLVVFPSFDGDRSLYEEGLFRDVVPASVERKRFAAPDSVPAARIDRFDLGNTLLDGISDEGGFQRPAVRQYFGMVPRETASVAARFGDGSAAVVSAVSGRGRVVVFGTDATLASGDLPLTGLFAPLVIRAVRYAAGIEPVGGRYVSGEILRETITSARQDARLVLKPENGPPRIVNTVPVPGGTAPVGEIAGEPGFYSFASGTAELTRFVVNTPSSEIRFERASKDRMERSFTGLRWKTAGSPDAVMEMVRKDRYGRELFSLFLLAAISLLVLEMVVSRKA